VVSFPGRDVSGLVAFLLYPALLLSLSGFPFRPFLVRFLPALPFSLMGGIGNLLVMREGVFSLGPWTVTAGMVSFVSILLKSFLTVSALLLLMALTPFTRLMAQLRLLRLPPLICLQLTMTYRYLSVLWDEAAAMVTAYTLRCGGAGIGLKDSGPFLGRLLLRGFDRAGRVYQAMKCRGYGEFPAAPDKTKPPAGTDPAGTSAGSAAPAAALTFGTADGLYTVLLCAAFAFLRFFNLSRFLGGLAAALFGVFPLWKPALP
jgi:cobalt/nickel transport system permease protein